MKKYLFTVALMVLTLSLSVGEARADLAGYVNPFIGASTNTEKAGAYHGLGKTYPGAVVPYGMVQVSPQTITGGDNGSGYSYEHQTIEGFAMTQMSGVGWYGDLGNFMVMPTTGSLCLQAGSEADGTPGWRSRYDKAGERAQTGYYAVRLTDYNIKVETSATTRCGIIRMTYPAHSQSRWQVDLARRVGGTSTEQFLQVVDEHTIQGYMRCTPEGGGWGHGDGHADYTVYFYATTSKPMTHYGFWDNGREVTGKASERKGSRMGFYTEFPTKAGEQVELKVGISFVSTIQARRNITGNTFDQQVEAVREAWQPLLSRITPHTRDAHQLRMFYTALYHTMLMPVDRSGENPKWSDVPYYDDYYAIWDTYRTSSPLLTIIAPDRQRDIIRSMLHIYRREGYLPEGRSGNSNGRTQGGSNAEVVLADAFVKHLDGIDYDRALEAMLKDATVPPGGNEEKEGRGGLAYYNTLGYIPYGVDRAGNRTIEYAFNDHCIATVAEGLGYDDIAEEYYRKAANWKHLWRKDYEYDGMKGFIMPRDTQGQWLDSVPWGKSKVFHPRILYTPTTKVAPWYLPWWSTFFYEATSEEYSLNIPHDVPGLIEACGGADAFRQRLDDFFLSGYYNVANEPSFLTPCLYHWIGRPDLSTRQVHDIIRNHYDDTPDGLPGNDDSGAMSSWLAFHMMGLYPNAGHDYYLLNLPILDKGYTLQLPNGRTLEVSVRGKGTDYDYATLNGTRLSDARITHDQLLEGGQLVFFRKKIKEEKQGPFLPPIPKVNEHYGLSDPFIRGEISYTLNKQFRTWWLGMAWDADTLVVLCKQTFYHIPRQAVENATRFCWDSPQKDLTTHVTNGTFAFISRHALATLLQTGQFVYDDITWREISRTDDTITVRADIDRTEMTISLKHPLPLVLNMHKNPLGIDWNIQLHE